MYIVHVDMWTHISNISHLTCVFCTRCGFVNEYREQLVCAKKHSLVRTLCACSCLCSVHKLAPTNTTQHTLSLFLSFLLSLSLRKSSLNSSVNHNTTKHHTARGLWEHSSRRSRRGRRCLCLCIFLSFYTFFPLNSAQDSELGAVTWRWLNSVTG